MDWKKVNKDKLKGGGPTHFILDEIGQYDFGLDPYKDSLGSKGSLGWKGTPAFTWDVPKPKLPEYSVKEDFHVGDAIVPAEDLEKFKLGNVEAINDKNTFIKTPEGFIDKFGIAVDMAEDVMYGKIYSVFL